MANSKCFRTQINLSQNGRERAITLLNEQLADTFDLFSQIKQAHWNVKGPHFIALHELFDNLSEQVEEFFDLIAERATALGGTAFGTARMAAALSRLPEYPLEAIDGPQHAMALSVRFAALGATSRSAIDTAAEFWDADTADIFTEISRGLDKSLWFLEAHLQE
jgi:starvation-inducible DNA-binding protein